MPRSGKVKKRKLKPDPLYQSRLVTRLINRVMKGGKKTVAQKHVYQALRSIEKKTGKDPLVILQEAVENIKPSMEVRPRRVGGAAYQVPMPVKGDRRESLAVRWLIKAARSRSNQEASSFSPKLALEIMAAQKNEGGAVKKKEEIHKIAEANRAFAHFRW